MAPSKSALTAGRVVSTLQAIFTLVGPYIADWNETHLFNPRWPPHARFHNGQTMSMGVHLSLLTAYFTWRPVLFPANYDELDSAWCAALVGGVYFITGMSAGLYPGTKWIDPEFEATAPPFPPQVPIFGACLMLAWVAYYLERKRIMGLGVGEAGKRTTRGKRSTKAE
jgi:hypothetical protein